MELTAYVVVEMRLRRSNARRTHMAVVASIWVGESVTPSEGSPLSMIRSESGAERGANRDHHVRAVKAGQPSTAPAYRPTWLKS